MIISITVYVLSLLILTASATVHGPDPIIGIDLGTKYSRVGIFEDGQVKIIPNEHGSKVTPSYVAFNAKGNRLIGDYAKHHLTSNPENTIYDVKRFIGRKWDDPMVQKYVQNYPFNMLEKNNKLYVKVLIGEKKRFFALEEISGMVLGKMKEIAEGYLNRQVINATITVPAYFNNAQRQATMDAGTIAGLNVLQIMNEPTAAAVAYRILKRDEDKTVLVFDLGGGTFDVSLINISHGVVQVLATSGDTQLGGEDFTQRVMNFLIKIHMKNTGVDIRKDKHALQKLHREVERATRTLSYLNETTIEVEDLGNTEDFSQTLTRSIFEALNIDLFESTMNVIKEVIKNGATRASDVDEIILVGGSTHIPKIQQLVNDYFFGKKPVYYANSDELVAHGAAVQGAVLGGADQVKNVKVKDVYPFTLWAETPDKKVVQIIHCNSLIPAVKLHTFSTASVDQSNALLMQLYEGKETFSKDANLLGRFRLHGPIGYPNNLNMLHLQYKVTFIIDRNSSLTVFAENEEIEYKKGKSPIFFNIIRILLFGMQEIEEYKNNKDESLFDIIKKLLGIAKDEETGNNRGASFYDILMESVGATHNMLGTKIQPAKNMDSLKLSSEEIKQMVKDAKNFTENDKKVKEIMDAQNELENFAYMIKHMISDKGKLGNILSKEDKTVINEEANNMIIWIESKYDLNDLKTKTLGLEQMMRKMIENTLYQGHLYSESKDREEL